MEDTKKRKSHKKIIVFFISLILVILIPVGILWVTGPHLLSTTSRDIQVYDHDKAFIDKHEYVFVAKVNDLVKTKQYDGTGTDIPYTFYSIDQIEFIKGEKQSDESLLCFYGGRKYIFFYSLLNSNDERIQENEYYLFIANQKAKNSTNQRIGENDFANTKEKDCQNTRIGENDFVIMDNYQLILLENYDINQTYDKQSVEIMNLIQEYQNLLAQN